MANQVNITQTARKVDLIMEFEFKVIKDERKALVKAVSEVTGCDAVYQGAPSFAFVVGDYTIDRYGTLICGEGIGIEDVKPLLSSLTEQGFTFEGNLDGLAPAAEPGETAVKSSPDRLAIEMPLSGITDGALSNLENLVTAKAWILKKMTGTESFPIERDERCLRFPWFKPNASADEIDAYSRLVAGLCETAKQKQRITAKEQQLAEGDNEKFKARCFLLSLGFIGKEYAQARKILLSVFSGNGSHKAGDGKKSAIDAGAFSTFSALRCVECRHHCYYTGGKFRTGSDEVVDTSRRKPEQYNHYCLNTPSGFRKIKHAVNWTGCELAPSWCSLSAELVAREGATAADGGEVDAKAISICGEVKPAANGPVRGEVADYE